MKVIAVRGAYRCVLLESIDLVQPSLQFSRSHAVSVEAGGWGGHVSRSHAVSVEAGGDGVAMLAGHMLSVWRQGEGVAMLAGHMLSVWRQGMGWSCWQVTCCQYGGRGLGRPC